MAFTRSVSACAVGLAGLAVRSAVRSLVASHDTETQRKRMQIALKDIETRRKTTKYLKLINKNTGRSHHDDRPVLRAVLTYK